MEFLPRGGGGLGEIEAMEELEKLSDEELGKRLAMAAGLKVFKHGYFFHYKTGVLNTNIFCKSLGMAAEIEKIVIETVGDNAYVHALADVVGLSLVEISGFEDMRKFTTASARQRCAALILALEGK